MRASWYDRQVRVRVGVSGIHVGSLGKRQGVVPHGDDAGVAASRVVERVRVYLAPSYRPFGIAAEYVTVPAEVPKGRCWASGDQRAPRCPGRWRRWARARPPSDPGYGGRTRRRHTRGFVW